MTRSPLGDFAHRHCRRLDHADELVSDRAEVEWAESAGKYQRSEPHTRTPPGPPRRVGSATAGPRRSPTVIERVHLESVHACPIDKRIRGKVRGPVQGVLEGERRDSNPRPPGPQPGALPTELRPPRLPAGPPRGRAERSECRGGVLRLRRGSGRGLPFGEPRCRSRRRRRGARSPVRPAQGLARRGRDREAGACAAKRPPFRRTEAIVAGRPARPRRAPRSAQLFERAVHRLIPSLGARASPRSRGAA